MTKLEKIRRIVLLIVMVVITIVLTTTYISMQADSLSSVFVSLSPWSKPFRFVVITRHPELQDKMYSTTFKTFVLREDTEYLYIRDWNALDMSPYSQHFFQQDEVYMGLQNNGSYIVLDSLTVGLLLLPSWWGSIVLLQKNLPWIKNDCKNLLMKWKKKKEKPPTEVDQNY